MNIVLNRKNITISWVEIIYISLIFGVFIYLGTDLAYNTAFIDEAIYATIGEEALRGSFWERGLSWMGGSYLYPILSAVINRGFGLAGVRMFSVVSILISSVIAGEIAYLFSGKVSRVLSVGLFLLSSISLNLGQLGTYDAPALLFFSLSVYFAVLSRDDRRGKYLAIILSAMLFSFAVMSKYIAIIFAPAIFLMITRFDNIYELFLRSAIWGLVAYAIVGIFFYINMESLLIFFTGSAFKEYADKLDIIIELAKSLKVNLFFGLFGAIILFLKQKKIRVLVAGLVLGAMMPFLYHFLFENIRSMWKHLVFSQVLLAPLAGYFLYQIYLIINKQRKNKVLIDNASQIIVIATLLLTIITLWISLREHWRFQRSWPSASRVIEFLDLNRREEDIIFAEGSAVFKYHLYAGFENPSAWTSTWYTQYEGKQGIEAMKAAIEDKHFDFVILNGYYTGDVMYELLPVIRENYDLVLKDTYVESGLYERETFVWAPNNSDREYLSLN